MVLADGTAAGGRLAVMFNGDRGRVSFSLPLRDEFEWTLLLSGEQGAGQVPWAIAGRTVALAVERTGDGKGMR